ncbi:carbohydrate-binding protein [Anaerotruncus colihominis]|nr:carbohydrate-binding protein [Anaerotruncus colihominis]MCR2025254.1 chitinase [Anaerotruncus colihominis]
MYLIINSNNLIAEICKHPSYVRQQDNGVVILSDEKDADAIYSNDSDTFWPTAPFGYANESHTLVEVDAVPPEVKAGYYFYHAGEFYTTEQNRAALARAKASEVASLMFVRMAENGAFDDTTIAEHAEQFSMWACSIAYAEGAICQYNGRLYRCLQAHTSQETWTPEAAPSQWKEIGDPTGEWPEWSQPVGAIDTYPLGAKVSYNGKHWVSTAGNNVWEPNVYGWEEAV